MAELRGLKVFTNGELSIVTFEDKGFLGSQSFIGDAGEHLDKIVDAHDTKILIFDLAGITGLPSDMLGVLVGLQHRGIEIRLFNITNEVRLILETTKLDDLFDVRDGDLSALINASEEE
ncbi:MAG TPA: STAS domain-containing protein [Pirellulaceae bacterium]|jgi:anti-anti-sigma regulatory factor|nr:STAS domain-containing protein [Pirellulaceae bacterium]